MGKARYGGTTREISNEDGTTLWGRQVCWLVTLRAAKPTRALTGRLRASEKRAVRSLAATPPGRVAGGVH